MTTLLLPHQQIALPRVEFPAWVRRIGDSLHSFGSPMGRGAFVQPMGGAGDAATQDLLLDTLTAAAAYSFRKLRTAYAGYAVKLREDATNTTQDFGFVGNDFDTAGVASWLSGAGAANAYGHTWYDQSGNGNDLVYLSTTARQPLYVVSATNGKPAFLGDGANYRMGRTSAILTTNTSITLMLVVNLSDTSRKGAAFGIGDTNGYAFGFGTNGASANGLLWAIFPAVRHINTSTTPAAGAHAVELHLNGSGVPSFVLDGAAVSGTYTGTNATAPTGRTDALVETGGSRYFNGHLSEAVAVASDVATSVFAEARTYYGI